MKPVSEILRRLWTESSFTQEQLASEAGVNICTVKNIIQGKCKSPGRDVIAKLSKALDVSPLEFYE